ncbi:hypothetical protein [Embleya scabrispora]|uniref:hypothetical protein n=1 Tax=Embleya scabrispora TaxID=159449 RepID=UPI0003829DB8|nr:hypothetical protein [Embleya scabrispora]MYS83592.1 hypothetical protein [Streptomyces sp. SID5474]
MDRKSLESAAADYSYLRGLLSIPAGVLFLVSGVTNLGWGPLDRPWAAWAAGALMGAAGALYLWLTRYYAENYGRVTPSGRARARAAIVTAGGAALVAGAVSLDWRVALPLSTTTAAFAAVMYVSYAVGMRPRPHHVAVWGTLAAAGLLPIWGDVGAAGRINGGLMLVGVATIVTGVLDHAALRRAFGPAQGPDLGGSDVGA